MAKNQGMTNSAMFFDWRINKFNESIKSSPKFNVGDRCVYVYPIEFGKGRKVLSVLDDDMTISGEPWRWYSWITYKIIQK